MLIVFLLQVPLPAARSARGARAAGELGRQRLAAAGDEALESGRHVLGGANSLHFAGQKAHFSALNGFKSL